MPGRVTIRARTSGVRANCNRPQEFGVDRVVPLLHPKCLEPVVLVIRVPSIQFRRPRPHRCNHHVRIALVEFQFREFTHLVLRLLQQLEQRRDRLAMNLRRRRQRAPFVRHAIDSAVFRSPMRIAQVIHEGVRNDRTMPIGEVNGTVGPDIDGDGPKVGIGRGKESRELHAAPSRSAATSAIAAV